MEKHLSKTVDLFEFFKEELSKKTFQHVSLTSGIWRFGEIFHDSLGQVEARLYKMPN